MALHESPTLSLSDFNALASASCSATTSPLARMQRSTSPLTRCPPRDREGEHDREHARARPTSYSPPPRPLPHSKAMQHLAAPRSPLDSPPLLQRYSGTGPRPRPHTTYSSSQSYSYSYSDGESYTPVKRYDRSHSLVSSVDSEDGDADDEGIVWFGSKSPAEARRTERFWDWVAERERQREREAAWAARAAEARRRGVGRSGGMWSPAGFGSGSGTGNGSGNGSGSGSGVSGKEPLVVKLVGMWRRGTRRKSASASAR